MHVEIINIHKSFGVNQFLKGVDFYLDDDEIYVLMGENGANCQAANKVLLELAKGNENILILTSDSRGSASLVNFGEELLN